MTSLPTRQSTTRILSFVVSLEYRNNVCCIWLIVVLIVVSAVAWFHSTSCRNRSSSSTTVWNYVSSHHGRNLAMPLASLIWLNVMHSMADCYVVDSNGDTTVCCFWLGVSYRVAVFLLRRVWNCNFPNHTINRLAYCDILSISNIGIPIRDFLRLIGEYMPSAASSVSFGCRMPLYVFICNKSTFIFISSPSPISIPTWQIMEGIPFQHWKQWYKRELFSNWLIVVFWILLATTTESKSAFILLLDPFDSQSPLSPTTHLTTNQSHQSLFSFIFEFERTNALVDCCIHCVGGDGKLAVSSCCCILCFVFCVSKSLTNSNCIMPYGWTNPIPIQTSNNVFEKREIQWLIVMCLIPAVAMVNSRVVEFRWTCWFRTLDIILISSMPHSTTNQSIQSIYYFNIRTQKKIFLRLIVVLVPSATDVNLELWCRWIAIMMNITTDESEILDRHQCNNQTHLPDRSSPNI